MVDPGTYWCVNYPIPNILVDVGGCLPIYVLLTYMHEHFHIILVHDFIIYIHNLYNYIYITTYIYI